MLRGMGRLMTELHIKMKEYKQNYDSAVTTNADNIKVNKGYKVRFK